MKPAIPPGYSLVTVRLFGKDVPLAALPDTVVDGFQKIVEGFRKGPPVSIKLSNGSKAIGYVKKRTPTATIIDVNGREVVAREKKANGLLKTHRSPTKVTVSGPN